MFALAVLAGAFISLGALLYTVVITGSTLGFGATRLLGGIGFSLGLILVVVAGAELFTGNNLVAMAWASRLVTFREVVRSWAIVYVGNLIGALATVALVVVGRVHEFGGGAVAETLHGMATHKLALDAPQAFALGVLCNALVCLAVWLSLAARSVTDKVLSIVFPIAAFCPIFCGEHVYVSAAPTRLRPRTSGSRGATCCMLCSPRATRSSRSRGGRPRSAGRRSDRPCTTRLPSRPSNGPIRSSGSRSSAPCGSSGSASGSPTRERSGGAGVRARARAGIGAGRPC